MNLPAAIVSLKDTAPRGGVQNMEPPQAAGYCTPVNNKGPVSPAFPLYSFNIPVARPGGIIYVLSPQA